MKNYDLLSNDVNLIGVIKARAVINRFLNRTNLIHYSELSRLTGCEVYVKHENHNPTGSFKIRGALNFFHHMSKEELAAGVPSVVIAKAPCVLQFKIKRLPYDVATDSCTGCKRGLRGGAHGERLRCQEGRGPRHGPAGG